MEERQTTSCTASCLCGAIALSADVEDQFGTCYCKMCQRWSAGTFRGVHAHNLRYTRGADLVTTHRSSDWAVRGFCAKCGSNLFYHADGHPISLALGILDDFESLSPGFEFYTDLKPAPFDRMQDARKMTSTEIEALWGGSEEAAT